MRVKVKAAAVAVLAILLTLLWLEPWLWSGTAYRLPVLMYHHFDTTSDLDTIVTEERFREQMAALKKAGYTTVTLQQVLDYVDNGTRLPKKSVLITMDDGYDSNVTIAAPILEEFGFCATVFVIGVDEGRQFNIHSGNPIYPTRFAYEDAIPWLEKGVLELQDHTFDMHQLAADGFSGRDGILPLEGEDLSAYRAALREDLSLFRQRREEHGIATPLVAMAYPYGFFSEESESVLREAGLRVTFTTMERGNLLRVGEPGDLWNMGRYNVTDHCTGKELVQKLFLF